MSLRVLGRSWERGQEGAAGRVVQGSGYQDSQGHISGQRHQLESRYPHPGSGEPRVQSGEQEAAGSNLGFKEGKEGRGFRPLLCSC